MKNKSYKLRISVVILVATMATSFLEIPAVFAANDIQLFSNETRQENANTMILDNDNTGGNVNLQFGNSLNEKLYWDNGNSTFTFTDDLKVEGDLTVTGVLKAGSSVLQLTNATGQIDGEQMQADSIDDDSLDFGTGADQISASDVPVNDLTNNSNNLNAQDVLQDLDTAIGNRTYTDDHYVSDAQTITQSIDALDQAISASGHTQNTDTGSTSDSFILNSDGTTATLQFGNAATDYLSYSQGTSLFTFSKSLLMSGASAIQFRDSALTVNSSADGQLDIDADTELEITAPTVDINSNTQIALNSVTIDASSNVSTTGTVHSTGNLTSSGSLILGSGGVGVTTILDEDTMSSNSASALATQQSIKAYVDATAASAVHTEKIFVNMNDLTVSSTGASSLADLYSASETGTNPHQYYYLKTTQGTLQSLAVKVKVKLPQDFDSFAAGSNHISVYYKTGSGAVVANKVDVAVWDDDNDNALNTQADGKDLVNTSWTEYADEFDNASFNPAAGEYIYVIVTGYTLNDGTLWSPYIGEIVLTYRTKRI
ncbi:MAG: hypothetical protein NTZ80_01660 [Patescibacteria group bacterium]|nr:hypothetical protein [Patescibacteria group bacterium]